MGPFFPGNRWILRLASQVTRLAENAHPLNATRSDRHANGETRPGSGHRCWLISWGVTMAHRFGAFLVFLALVLPVHGETAPPAVSPVLPPTISHDAGPSLEITAEPFTPKSPAEGHETPPDEFQEADLPPFHRLWAQGEFLLWRIRNSSPPLLATTGSASDPVPGAEGFLGSAPLFGGATLNNSYRSGARFFLGGWFNEEEQLGAEIGYFFLGSRNVNFSQGGDGSTTSPIIARPFFNAVTGQNDASLVSFPGLAGGALNIINASRMEGTEANAVSDLFQNREFCIQGLTGFRFVHLKEFLSIQEAIQVDPGAPVFPGEKIGLQDYFGATNYFYGGQVGLKATMRTDHWSIDVLSKVALGSMVEVVNINGATAITPAGGQPQIVPGGLLAQPSNSGQFQRSVFAVVPEVGVQLSYHITENIHATAG